MFLVIYRIYHVHKACMLHTHHFFFSNSYKDVAQLTQLTQKKLTVGRLFVQDTFSSRSTNSVIKVLEEKLKGLF